MKKKDSISEYVKIVNLDTPENMEYHVNIETGKDRQKFIDQIKKIIRGSKEYRDYIQFLKDHMDLNKCAFFQNINGEKTGYAKVQKKNGKWNYIDIQTGIEQMPLDFESLTTMNSETGMFQAEYNGTILDACLDGFMDDNGEGHTWDELNDYLANQNDNDDLNGF